MKGRRRPIALHVHAMPMMTAERELFSATARTVDTRSPFVRLSELVADLKPAMPVINLAVGEPQHPVPHFVAPIIAAHIGDFGRYPAGKGTERLRRAAADWL